MVGVEWVDDAADERVVAAAALIAQWERDELGEDEPTTAEEVAFWVHVHSSGLSGRLAVAVMGSQVTGAALVAFDPLAEPDNAWLHWLVVDPAHRREGVGRSLIDAVATRARGAGCSVVTHGAPEDSAGASRFAAAVGAVPGLVNEQNRLRMGDVPAGLLEGWAERVAERAAGYSLVTWTGVCPEEYLDRCARAYEIMNTAPQDPGAEPIRASAERVRAGQELHAARMHGFFTTVLHEASGELVALTELGQIRSRPRHADQGDTCTDPAHRNRGLGRWIKAHNLLWLLREHPEVEHIDTWNANVNEPMLKINRAMGYRRVRTWRNWRLRT